MAAQELTIEEIKKTMEGYGKKFEDKTKELLANGKTEGAAEVKALKEEVDKINTYVKSLEEQQKQLMASSIPGADKKEIAKEFSISSYVRALYNQHSGNTKFGGGNAWEVAHAEKERDMCKAAYDEAKKRENFADDGSSGGFLVPPEVTDEIIDLAVAMMPILQMGTTVIRGLRGDLPVPKLTARSSSFFVGETEAPTESSPTFGEIILRPKKVAAFTKVSNRLLFQSRGVADQLIKEQLRTSLALKMHDGLVTGTGSDKQPLGITNATGLTTSTVALGDNGGRFRIDDASLMETDIEDADELVMATPESFGYLMHPRVKGGLKREKVAQFSGQADRNAQPIMAINPLLSQAVIEETLGYKLRTTTQVSKAETTGTSTTTSSVLFGNWKMFWVAMWRDLQIKVSEHASDAGGNSAFLQDQLYILALQEYDSQLMRGTAFTKVAGAETTASAWQS